jgi:outer membrane protein assembly factor BamB
MSLRLLVAAAAVLVAAGALAGCIKLPSATGSADPGAGTTDDFNWKGSAGLGHGSNGKVAMATPKLQLTLGDPAATGLSKWTPRFDSMPKAYDLDGDGSDEIIAQGNDTHVYVFSSRTGRVLADLATPPLPAGWFVDHILNPVEAGVLVPGERPSLVVADTAARVTVWQFASGDASAFQFEKKWERRLNQCNPQPSMDARAVLSDLDGDGSVDILLQTEEVGVFALKADGSTLWKQCWAGGNADPVAADLDGDGRPEAIFAADDGYLSVLDGAKGTVKWTYDVTTDGVSPGSIAVSPTVADIDGRLPKEILFTARNAPKADPSQYGQDHMAIVAVHADASTNWEGRALWVRHPEWANPLSYTHLVVRDVDGDGKADLFGMDWNTIGHKPGNWERLGPAHVFRLDANGQDVWVQEIDTWWSNKDIALVDATGDGVPDVLANGPYVGQDGLWVLSAATGDTKAFLPAGGWKVLRGPQLIDLDHDGELSLVLPVEPVDPADSRGAILVVDLGLKDAAQAGAA